jgi:hypothetical protein
MITIVSGLPRSGTSLMMQMLVAGGMLPLSDGRRAADVDNPRGYFEWEHIKKLPSDPGCIAEAEGKVVKVISRLLLALPHRHEYRIIFMLRPLSEVLASQDRMLQRHRTHSEPADPKALAVAFERHLQDIYAWIESKANARSLQVRYHDLLQNPRGIAQMVADFLGLRLNLEQMVLRVDASLYRNRSTSIREISRTEA